MTTLYKRATSRQLLVMRIIEGAVREPAMITNERQYKITRTEADRFRAAINGLTNGPTRSDVHPRLLQAEREAMESQLADLQAEIVEYERLKSAGGLPATP